MISAARPVLTLAARALLAAPLAFCVAGPVAAKADAGWNAKRAGLFSQVCMGAAPDFAAFDRIAGEAGFEPFEDEFLIGPEIFVSLQSDEEGCVCDMTVGALNQPEMAEAMFRQLLRDFPDSWRPATAQDDWFDTLFERDGVTVRLVLIPTATDDGLTWMTAQVIGPEECPA